MRLTDRRNFLKMSVAGGISCLLLPASFDTRTNNGYRLELLTATRLYDGKSCWSHPRAGIIPQLGKDGAPRVVMTMFFVTELRFLWHRSTLRSFALFGKQNKFSFPGGEPGWEILE